MNFQNALQFGRLGESWIAGWIKAQGFHVQPVYEKQTGDYKGPTLYMAEGDTLILPDLLALQSLGNGRVRIAWCEAKHKSAFTWYFKRQQWQTGIDVRLYEQYQAVQARSAIAVHLFFLQSGGLDKRAGKLSPGGLYGNRLAYLAQHEDHRDEFVEDNGRRVPMVYWNITDLRKLADYQAVQP